ncbi:MAG: hypothetical protein QX196_15535 [Methylococcaceae bacterium]
MLQETQGKNNAQTLVVDYTDGLSMEFSNWRFNLRSSNTEPLVRLNVESCGDEVLMQAKTEELLALLALVSYWGVVPADFFFTPLP